jgi:hypothetical protein
MISCNEQLSADWTYNAGEGALIWQLMFTGAGDLVGQKRFPSTRQASFFTINPETGQVLSDDFHLMDAVESETSVESWFTGIETTSRDLLYCYTYQPQSPEHQGIWAIDPKIGREVWVRRDITFAANLDHEFLVYRRFTFGGFPERHFMLLDPLSGEVISDLGTESMSINAIRAQMIPEEERQQVILPDFVTEGMAPQQLALQRAGVSDPHHCESVLYGRLTLAALHEPVETQGLWNSMLKVWQDDRLLYSDAMELLVEKPCLNNFLIQSDRLYYIKNKKELLCVALT